MVNVKENIKEKIDSKRFAMGTALVPAVSVVSALPAFASSNDTSQNLTTGITGFMAIVTSMLEAIMGSPTLQIAFAASFAFLGVRLVRKLKKG